LLGVAVVKSRSQTRGRQQADHLQELWLTCMSNLLAAGNTAGEAIATSVVLRGVSNIVTGASATTLAGLAGRNKQDEGCRELLRAGKQLDSHASPNLTGAVRSQPLAIAKWSSTSRPDTTARS